MRKTLKEQDLSKIRWERTGKHRYWFQYHNTFSRCRTEFTDLLKKLREYFGDDVTKEVNQLIVSVKRALVKDLKANPSERKAVKEGIVKYLKPEFERIGIVWTDEDEEELKALPNNNTRYRLEKKKDLVENALWEWTIGGRLYTTCRGEYNDKRDDYENRDRRDYKKDLEQSQIDYTKISGDNKELQGKLKAANVEIERLRLALKNAGRRNTKDIKRRN